MKNLKEKVKEKLYELADEKYKKFHTALCPGVENILGIRVPILRNYAKEIKKEYNLEELIQNIDDQYYEEIMLKGMIIGMILDYYIKEEYILEDFKIFENTKSDKYYIQMAVAWAISICFIKFYDETKEFMKKSNIEKFTYNKAIQKAIESYRITEEQKEELRKMKKKI